MDKLEKFFNEQHDAFDEEPKEGHLNRFDARLDQIRSPKKSVQRRGWPFLQIAAAAVILLLAANLFVYLLPQKTLPGNQTASHGEMDETATFYTTRINSGMSQLKQMADRGIGTESELVQIKKEMDEMDHLHQDLQKEYSENPNDERVINAMIEYYQTKLNIINTIKTDLENIKTIKNNSHETTKL
jgi:hypothetical protein